MEYIPLRIGAVGPAVEQVQKTLESVGYPVGEIDGHFGPQTYQAVAAFQADHELPVDGVVAKNTWDALEKRAGVNWVIGGEAPPEAADRSPEAARTEERTPERAPAPARVAGETPPAQAVPERPGPERQDRLAGDIPPAKPEEEAPEPEAQEVRLSPQAPVQTVPLLPWDTAPEPGPVVPEAAGKAVEERDILAVETRVTEAVEADVVPETQANTAEEVLVLETRTEEEVLVLEPETAKAPDPEPVIDAAVPVSAPAPAAGLRLGSRNSQVMDLQRRLKELGYYTGAVTGYFGELTYRSLARFQEEAGLQPTGVGDEMTLALIRQQQEPGVLSRGDRGEAVTRLQEDLKALGFYPSEICGIFGDETLEGVIGFQESAGLPPTGRVNRRTRQALDEALRGADAITAASEIVVLRPGDSGREILALQRLLHEVGYYDGVLDGVYGSGTTIAVENFQRDNGLLADGIAGPATLDLLEQQAGDSEDIPDQSFTNMQEGDSGEQVRLLQDRLKQLGIFAPSITGSFGPATAGSVRQFQEDSGLPVTGVVDASTWDALIKQTAPPIDITLPPHGASRPTIRYGDTGEDVERLQQELQVLMYYRGEINGVFDTDTLVAVKSFQDAYRLMPDGVVGNATWNALIALYPPPVVCD